MKNHTKGFTFLELLVTLGILALLALISFPSFKSYRENLDLKNSTKEIVAQLKLAQQLTVTQQINHSIKFFTLSDTYSLIKKSVPEETIANFQTSPTVIIEIVNSLPDNEAEYNPAGGVYNTGEVILLHLNSDKETIINIKPSGYVTWNNYEE